MKPALLLCLLIALPGQLPAQEAGRLFHTPAERAFLDAEKYRGGQPSEQNPHYQGMVRRSQGPTTLWRNGQALSEPEQGIPPPAPQGVAGNELLRGGQITIHPPRAAPRP